MQLWQRGAKMWICQPSWNNKALKQVCIAALLSVPHFKSILQPKMHHGNRGKRVKSLAFLSMATMEDLQRRRPNPKSCFGCFLQNYCFAAESISLLLAVVLCFLQYLCTCLFSYNIIRTIEL